VVEHAREQVDESAHSVRGVFGAGIRALIGTFGSGLDQHQAERRPVRRLLVVAVE
jgi:hypothetical protein